MLVYLFHVVICLSLVIGLTWALRDATEPPPRIMTLVAGAMAFVPIVGIIGMVIYCVFMMVDYSDNTKIGAWLLDGSFFQEKNDEQE